MATAAPEKGPRGRTPHCAWLHQQVCGHVLQDGTGVSGLEGGLEEGCIASVTFEFSQRPEWLEEGARLVVHDRTDNCLSGAGIVRRLFFQA